MYRTRDVITPSLDHALLATRVMAALQQLDNPQPSPLIAGAIDDAVRFLQNIIEGKRYTERREVSENSYESALAYGEAIRAIELLPEPTDAAARLSVTDVVGERLKAARAISQQQPVDRDAVSELLKFFSLVRDVAMKSDPKPIETLSFSE
jgi:hypothetical protein